MSSLLRGTAIVSLLTQLSRVLGFVREVLTARLLGAGFYADAYVAAFRIPNLLRSFLAEGALTSAFVPLFAGELGRGKENAALVLQNIAGFLLCSTTALSVLGLIYAPEIVGFMAPGFQGEKHELCVLLTRIMFPYIMLVSLVAMLNGALNAIKVFGTGAWAQVLMNIALISGAGLAFLTPRSNAAIVLSWSVLVGGLIGVVAQLRALKRGGLPFRFRFHLRHPAIRELLILMLPAIFGAAVYQLNILLQTLLASLLKEGSVSWIYYADRLGQLPIGVFTVALGSVLLPTLSEAQSKGDQSVFLRNLGESLRYTSFLMLPVALTLGLFAVPLFQLFLEGGEFHRSDTIAAAQALQAMTMGLWGVSCHSIAMKAFLARKDTVTPTIFSALSLFLSLLFSLLLMGPPASGDHSSGALWVRSVQTFLSALLPTAELGHVGLCLSSSITSLLLFLVLALLMGKRFPDFKWGAFMMATGKALIGVGAAAGTIVGLGLSEASAPLQLFVGLPLVGIVFVGTCFVLRAQEILTIREVVQRKLLRRAR